MSDSKKVNTTASPPPPDEDSAQIGAEERAPRLPYERDESLDSGSGPPRELMKIAHDDAESDKTSTDRGEVTEEVYARTLRDAPPGDERDRTDEPSPVRHPERD